MMRMHAVCSIQNSVKAAHGKQSCIKDALIYIEDDNIIASANLPKHYTFAKCYEIKQLEQSQFSLRFQYRTHVASYIYICIGITETVMDAVVVRVQIGLNNSPPWFSSSSTCVNTYHHALCKFWKLLLNDTFQTTSCIRQAATCISNHDELVVRSEECFMTGKQKAS